MPRGRREASPRHERRRLSQRTGGLAPVVPRPRIPSMPESKPGPDHSHRTGSTTAIRGHWDPAFGHAFAAHAALMIVGHTGIAIVPKSVEICDEAPGLPNAQDSALLSRRQVAEWLVVSKRWVERHLRPSAQAAPRGRAWYSRRDVEEQLAKMSVRLTSGDGRIRTVAPGAEGRLATQRLDRPKRSAHARRVSEIETELRETTRGNAGRAPTETR